MNRKSLFLVLLAVCSGFLVSLVVLLGGFELYLRQIGYLDVQPAAYPCITGDPILNHVFQPNCEAAGSAKALKTTEDVTYKTNSLGMRSGELRAGAKKILVLGDSYTDGFGLSNESTFPSQLERELGKRSGDVQVLNGGIVGFSPALYFLLFNKKFESLRADYVLLNLDFTDMNDDVYFLGQADFGSDGFPSAFPSRNVLPGWLLNYVFSNKSALLRFLDQEVNQWHQGTLRKNNLPRMKGIVDVEPRLMPADWFQGNEACRDHYELTAKLVKRLQAEVVGSGARFAIHMYPPGYEVKKYPERKQKNISFVQKWREFFPEKNPYPCGMNLKSVAIWKKFADKEGIAFFDSTERVLQKSEKEKLYFDEDAHWNKDGVKFVVEGLVEPLWKDFRQFSTKQGKRSGK